MGDFNAEVTDLACSRAKLLGGLLQDCQLFSVNTRPYCVGPKGTCVSYVTDSMSMIDHILFPTTKEDTVVYCGVADDVPINVSNHRPVWMQFVLPDITSSHVNVSANLNKASYNWAKADSNVLAQYSDIISQVCNDATSGSSCISKYDVDSLYDRLTTGIKDASDRTVPIRGYRPYLKPYWNDQLKQLHKYMVDCRVKWIDDGKPRDRLARSFAVYKEAKRIFRSQHRKCARLYLDELHREVDRCAEVDQKSFYKIVNAKRKRYATLAGCEIKFDQTICRDPAEIAENWGNYFRQLYTPTMSPNFNDEHYDLVNHDMPVIEARNASVTACNVEPITTTEVEKECKQLPLGKAGGYDSLTNEHLKHGGGTLFRTLAYLFNAILSLGYVPCQAKRGVIITLYKGGGKKKDSPNSYRAITLTPVITKLLERILLQRLQVVVGNQFPHPLQNGFLPKMNSTMTSFVITECVRFAKERGNKLYAAFLDAEKAFDNVWIAGLLWKLDKIGIQGQYWNVVNSLYTDVSSCVVYSGCKSDWFTVLQGTRQGGVLSPWLFLLFIDDLLKSLSDSKTGLSVMGLDCCAPTQADDITLLALTKANLDTLLKICYVYACRWRLVFNPTKSIVMVFNEKSSARRRSRVWHLGDHKLKEVDSILHLGFILNKELTQNDNVTKACNKARGSFLGFINCGLHGEGFHPLTSLKIYTSVVLPSALYGSELWSSLTNSNMLALEKVQHFCLKVIQGLPKRTRSDIAMGLLGVRPLEYAIHQRKLTFLGSLCRLKRDCTVKRLFLIRLFEYDFISPLLKQGFIPDIWSILRTYELVDILSDFMTAGTFPVPCSWKQSVRCILHCRAEQQWQNRLCTDIDFIRYNRLQETLRPNMWWLLSKKLPNLLFSCRTVIRLCALTQGQTQMTCTSCGTQTQDCSHHLMTCSAVTPHIIRENFWTAIINLYGVNVYARLDAFVDEDLITALLGIPNVITELFAPDELVTFLTLVAKMLTEICKLLFPDISRKNNFS